MGSEADAEAANASAADSDGSVSWEDFFGTSTDLVPQLLGMFDELARRGNGYTDHVVLSTPCNIPVVLQKRLSLVPHSHRGSVFGQFRKSSDVAKSYQSDQEEEMSEHTKMGLVVGDVKESAVVKDVKQMKETNVYTTLENNSSQCDLEGCRTDEKSREVSYRRDSSGLTPLRYSRRCRNTGRPLSGSSVASSTSSSGCSNQGNTCTINPYLASVESLADTCASSQGSGDSGVITVSEASCRIGNDSGSQRRDSAEDASCHRPRYCDPHRNPVERVLLEIVDTEAIYVDHLQQVIRGYLMFWRNDHASFAQKMQLTDLFSNIEDIFEFNREFLKEIEKCNLDPVCVANTFIKHNSGFKVYTEYCTNYPRTVSVLTDLMGQEETANAFRERQAALGHALPLGSFLLKPVQRILKYHLLLENLSKEYGADCNFQENEAAGRKAIEGALAAMTGIAKHINAMKRRHEHAVRVQEIQSLLYGWPGPDLTTSGELVAEGRFRMRGAKAPRHAFLFDRMLLLTKKKEDGLLVYKAHIMCSNLMLIESIPGEPLSFHVIPFDNPRLQYTLQARNLEQKREWTLQIKRVILENYNAVIPSHARQLVLQLGQTQPDDDVFTDRSSAKKQHSAPPEYLEKRKQERERRRSETGLRQKFKKGGRKSETTTEDSPASPRKNQYENSNISNSKEQTPKSLDGRTIKVKDRFTGWRRKSEPGFQSYVCLNHSDEEQREDGCGVELEAAEVESTINLAEDKSSPNGLLSETKDYREDKTQAQTVEEIVGHILMQNQEFQKLLEKQRTNSTINVRQQQRFHKHMSAASGCNGIGADTSDESDSESLNYITESSNNKVAARIRTTHREQRLVRTNNSWNSSLSSSRDNQPTLQLLYDNFKNGNKSPIDSTLKNKGNRVHEKKALFEAFKRQSIVTESRVIKTALRIRENSASGNEEIVTRNSNRYFEDFEKEEACKKNADIESNEENQVIAEVEKQKSTIDNNAKGFGNYDNLQHVWEGLQEEKEMDGTDSPTRPAVWLTKLCEGLPTSPQKCGSLPRSFQINPNSSQNFTKTRFLQRDGKPMSERPFTIASDKPAEINLEDMERYATSCQPEGRIAKFPTSVSTSSSTFFYSLDDTLTDAYSDIQAPSSTMTNIHPDHKIYRANTSGNTMFKNVLSKAGNRLQVLRNTMSTETLECSEEFERTKYFRSLSSSKLKKKGKLKHARESSSDVEELVGCTARGSSDSRIFSSSTLYYKQGSSSLGARIAQSDYADPAVLFSEAKRIGQHVNSSIANTKKDEKREVENTQRKQKEVSAQEEVDQENAGRGITCGELDDQEEEEEDTVNHGLSETDSFYEKSFETIENYVDADIDDAFRDSAIFSDIEEALVMKSPYSTNLISTSEESMQFKSKIAPPVPRKKKLGCIAVTNVSTENVLSSCKPSVAQKPDHLKLKSVLRGPHESEIKLSSNCLPQSETCHFSRNSLQRNWVEDDVDERDDVSAGQSQAGWVRKIVGQLQGHIEM